MKNIILLALLAIPMAVHGQVSSYATLYCLNPSGHIIPVLQAGTPAPSNYPGVQAFGANSSKQSTPLRCDASGNLTALPPGWTVTGSDSTQVVPITTYTGTAGVSATGFFTTPSGAQHQYMVCATGMVTTAGTAGNFNLYSHYHSNGHFVTITFTGMNLTTAGNATVAPCSQPFVTDTSSSIDYQVYMNAATGSPAIQYGFSILQLQ